MGRQAGGTAGLVSGKVQQCTPLSLALQLLSTAPPRQPIPACSAPWHPRPPRALTTSRTAPAAPSVTIQSRSASPCLRTQGMTDTDTTSSGVLPAWAAK